MTKIKVLKAKKAFDKWFANKLKHYNMAAGGILGFFFNVWAKRFLTPR